MEELGWVFSPLPALESKRGGGVGGVWNGSPGSEAGIGGNKHSVQMGVKIHPDFFNNHLGFLLYLDAAQKPSFFKRVSKKCYR